MRQVDAAVEGKHSDRALSRPAEPLAVDRPVRAGRGAAAARRRRDCRCRDRRRRDRGNRDGVLPPAGVSGPRAARRARPCGPRGVRSERRAADHVLRATALRARREVRQGTGGRGPARLRRRARTPRPDGCDVRRHGAGGALQRAHGYVQPEPPRGSPEQPLDPRASRAAAADMSRLGGCRVPPRAPARFAGLYDVVPRARIRELLEVGTTSATRRCCRRARAARTAACSASRCCATWSAASRSGSTTRTAPTPSGSS